MGSYAFRDEGISWSLYTPRRASDVCILYLQGFPSSAQKSKYYPFFQECVRRGFSVATLSYPGVQDSKGAFSGAYSLSAAHSVLEVLRGGSSIELYGKRSVDWSFSKILVCGSSFGGALALCSKGFDGIIAVSAVTDWTGELGESDEDIEAVCRRVFPQTIELAPEWNNWEDINAIDSPPSTKSLLFHSINDPIVFFDQAKNYSSMHDSKLISIDSDEHLTVNDLDFDALFDHISSKFF